MKTLKIVAALFCFSAVVPPSWADVTAPSGRVIECFCTDRYGKRHELGDIICLTVDSRSYMAKCVMAQNNPFWRDQNMGCLSSKGPKIPMTPKPKVLAFLR